MRRLGVLACVLWICLASPARVLAGTPDVDSLLRSVEQAVSQRSLETLGGLLGDDFEYRYIKAGADAKSIPVAMNKKTWLDSWTALWKAGVDVRLSFGKGYETFRSTDGVEIDKASWVLDMTNPGSTDKYSTTSKGRLELRIVDAATSSARLVVSRWTSELDN